MQVVHNPESNRLKVEGTSVTFGTGSVCDYPANTMLTNALNEGTCLDDIGFDDL